MTKSTATIERSEFLETLQPVIEHVLLTVDLVKLSKSDLDGLYAHFELITNESWEESDYSEDALKAFKRETFEALGALKYYVDSLNGGEEAVSPSSQQRDLMKLYLREGLSNRFLAEGVSQKMIPALERTTEIQLVKTFNEAATALRSSLENAFKDNALDRLDEDQKIDLAMRITDEMRINYSDNPHEQSIFDSIVSTQALKSLGQLSREMQEGSGTKRILNAIFDQARDDLLQNLFDISENLGVIPTDLRMRDDLGFTPPRKGL